MLRIAEMLHKALLMMRKIMEHFLLMGGVFYGKEWMIGFGCSFTFIVSRKKKLLSLVQVSIVLVFEFDHLIVCSLSCILKKDDVCAMGYNRLRFESLHETIKDAQMECLEQVRDAMNKTRRGARRVLVHALNEARGRKEGALNEVQHTKLPENDQTLVLVRSHMVLVRAH